VVWDHSALILVRNSVAVLMAVRFQLSCFLLRDIAMMVMLYLFHIKRFMRHAAAACNSLQNGQKTDSKSAGLRPVGVRPPPGTNQIAYIALNINGLW
jgi:hypothetical protein